MIDTKLILNKLHNFFRKFYWWRLYYRKHYLTAFESYQGNCIYCDASKDNNRNPNLPICDDMNICPCTYDKCLKIKNTND